jgi:hypothetical protein
MHWKERASKFRREERYAMPLNSGHPILLWPWQNLQPAAPASARDEKQPRRSDHQEHEHTESSGQQAMKKAETDIKDKM